MFADIVHPLLYKWAENWRERKQKLNASNSQSLLFLSYCFICSSISFVQPLTIFWNTFLSLAYTQRENLLHFHLKNMLADIYDAYPHICILIWICIGYPPFWGWKCWSVRYRPVIRYLHPNPCDIAHVCNLSYKLYIQIGVSLHLSLQVLQFFTLQYALMLIQFSSLGS